MYTKLNLYTIAYTLQKFLGTKTNQEQLLFLADIIDN